MNLFYTIMTIYSVRYQKALKQKLIDLLRIYDSFKNIQSDDFKIPNNFPKWFQNKSLLEEVKSIEFLLIMIDMLLFLEMKEQGKLN